MSLLATVSRPLSRRQAVGGAPASAQTVLERIDSINGGPDYHWRFGTDSDATMTARVGGVNGTWQNTTDVHFGIDPLTTNAASGKAVGLGGSDPSGGHGTISVTGSGISLPAVCSIAGYAQLDRTATKYQVVNTETAGNGGAGSFAFEFVSDGAGGMKPRTYRRKSDGSGVIYVGSSTSTVPVGSAFSWLAIFKDGGVDVYVDGSIVAMSLDSGTAPASWPAVSADTLYIGIWHSGLTPYNGLLSELAIWTGYVATASDASRLAIATDVVWMRSFDAGQVPASQTTDISLDKHIHPEVNFTPAVVSQPSLGTASVSGQQIEYAAGGSTGDDDTFTAKITKGGQDSPTRTITMDVVTPPGDEDTLNLGNWVGSFGWGAAAGNGGGIGRVFDYWSYRWKADRSGSLDLFRFNLPTRPGYFGGTGGILRLTIRANNASAGDEPDLTGGGVLWQSPDWVLDEGEHPDITKIAGEIVEIDLTAHGTASTVAVTAGEIYHFVWTNHHANVIENWYSINNAFNRSLPHTPYHPYGPWSHFNTLTSTNGGSSFGTRNMWIPFNLIHYTDGVWVGQAYFDCGSTSAIATPESPTLDKAGREIIDPWQSRQRFTMGDTVTMTRFRGRLWRRNSSTTDPLRVRVEREESGGGITTLADIDIPASSFEETNWDNKEGEVFPCIDVSLGGNVLLESGKTYRLRLSSGSSTRYAMRAPIAYDKTTIGLGWSVWPGRGEYSTDGGASWTGMHAYNTDNRSDVDWAMALHNVEG